MIKRLRGISGPGRFWPHCSALRSASAFRRRLARGSGRRSRPCRRAIRPARSRTAARAEQAAAVNPICVRLEGQLAALNRGGADPAAPIRSSATKMPPASSRPISTALSAQAKRRGCESGFFSLFTGQAPECQPLNAQIQQMRDNLDRTMSDLERLKSGNNYDQEGQRRR